MGMISRSNLISHFYFTSKLPNLASIFFFSTKTQKTQSSLHDRIAMVRDPTASIFPILDQWVSEGNTLQKPLLISLVYLMNDQRRFNHALQILHWMTDRRHFRLSAGEAAVRLKLIHRVYGLHSVEKSFEQLSDKQKTHHVYGALLASYVRENSVQKAEAIMQEMKEKGMATSSFAYNMMINLYRQNENLEKINLLIEEMERNGIPQDQYTINNLMAAYVAAANISGIEKILNKLEKDSQLDQCWSLYSTAASGYLKVGLTEKALTMLQKVEKIMPKTGENTLAFKFLISLYAAAGKKDELYRIWYRYKPSSVNAKETRVGDMITALSKLDDIEGAEKIFEEWEAQCTKYDFHVLNRLIVAYCKNGLLDKAEAAVKKAANGRTPYASTWNVLAMGYVSQSKLSKAVNMLKRALSAPRRGWSPNPTTLTACFEYLEKRGDVEEMEEIMKSLRTMDLLNRDMYHTLFRTYSAAGRPVSKVVDQMKLDGIDADEETTKILEGNKNVYI
ncbi:pentatricopeptide repeat-containing protein At2g20710, mitochondrial-like [Mercurialis annua]|uniref:pentatricopeptide repeat-containing protein At2g20710, mitochondrial-like n=1 Tax=Mercurialis annua TaxID=3986 RepID=UPI00215ED272|nr:pentatricopeptide repeat-containing protein At2g20710, mitochondrial-like [Mercurialis annua]